MTDPFQARQQINAGKLAVVMGIEVSKLFDCGVQDGEPECTAEQITGRLNEVYDLGVRGMELVNKFNALGGGAGDSGTTGLVVNVGNRIETGRFWQMGPCEDPHNLDRPQTTTPAVPDRDQLAGNILHALLPPGAVPLYGQPPHCNALGLSPLGEHLVTRMMEAGMIIDPDHLSVLARRRLLDIVEQRGYSGVVSSHRLEHARRDPADPAPRRRRHADGRFHLGVRRRLAGDARAPRPSLLLGHRLGRRHERLRVAGRSPRRRERRRVPVPIVRRRAAGEPSAQRAAAVRRERRRDGPLRPLPGLGRGPPDPRRPAGRGRPRAGAEAHLQMWQRAVGVPPTTCEARLARATRRGLGRVRPRARATALLRRAGQPSRRRGGRGRGARRAAAG